MVMGTMFILKMYGGLVVHDRKSILYYLLNILKMKELKKIGLIITLICVFTSCDKLPDPAGLRGVAVVPAITDINPGIFDSKDLENTYVEFNITVPEGSHPDKITILGSYMDNFERVLIAETSSFPSTIRVYCSDAAQKLGVSLDQLVNGDLFIFELSTLANNRATLSPAVLIVPIACAYDVELATGSYHAVSDWPSEYDVTIAADPGDPFTILVTGLGALDGAVEDNGPFVLHINPATYSIIAETKTITSDYYGYGAVTYSGNGVFSSCDGSYTLYIDISVGAYGSQGIYQFSLTRNP